MSDEWKSWWRSMLKHPSWQKMRLEVMERASFKCEKIGCEYILDETNPLNVHHKYYDEENRWLEPWKYPRGSLQCLCEKHHRQIHGIEEEVIEDEAKQHKILPCQQNEIKELEGNLEIINDILEAIQPDPSTPKLTRKDHDRILEMVKKREKEHLAKKLNSEKKQEDTKKTIPPRISF